LSQKTRAHLSLPSRNRNGACDDSLRTSMKNSSRRRTGLRAKPQPRPNRGILVAITVMKGTLDSSGRPAI
jgi:hypothetical protein